MSERVPLSDAAKNAQTRRRVAEEGEAIGPGLSADNGLLDLQSERPPERRVRKPFGNRDQKLAYPNREGFHRHWFNDEPGRILQARDAGYEQVSDERGNPVQMVVGVGRGGNPQVAFLMEIPQQYYDEDMAAQDGVVHEVLTQIRDGNLERPTGRDGKLRYAGSTRGDISITTSTRR